MKNKSYTVKTYSALPKKEREKWGFYIRPSLYLWDSSDEFFEGNNDFTSFFKKEYPIQAFFRETLMEKKDHIIWWFQRKFRNIKASIVSENASTEDLVPKLWMDKTELIPHMILQMTLDFQKEANESYCYKDIENWESDDPCAERQKEFKKWLDKTCYRIKVVLPYIEKRYSDSLNKAHKSKEEKYEKKYKYHNYWEEMLNKTTDRLCKEIIDKRQHFWT